MAEGTPWEYRVQTLGGVLRGIKDEALEAELNTLGEEGWELVEVITSQGSGRITLVAKRPLTPAARRRRSYPEGSWSGVPSD